MWVIKNKHTENIFYLSSEKKKYTIGRSGSDIVLRGDSSISRFHAVLYVHPEFLSLEDVGSKYGTYHNDQIDSKTKIPRNIQVALKEHDRILFGALKNEWVVSKSDIITVVSSLTETQLREVNSYLKPMGGSVVTTWNSKCTHLTMPELTITIKLLLALIEDVPIVSIEFWKDYMKNIRDKMIPPDERQYLPTKNVSLSSAIDITHFKQNNKRKMLFNGKTFIFTSRKQCETYSPIVFKSGGNCKDLNINIPKKSLLQKNSVVIQCIGSTQTQNSQSINAISEYLQANGLRIIPEYEIGLAIVCCSVEKYCNPSYSTNVLPNTEQNAQNIGTILVENTHSEKSDQLTPHLQYLEIPDSDKLKLESNSDPHIPLHSEVYECSSQNVQPKSTDSCSKNNTKRKRSEESENNTQVVKKPHILDIDRNIDTSSNKNECNREGEQIDNISNNSKIMVVSKSSENICNKRNEKGTCTNNDFLRKSTLYQNGTVIMPVDENIRPVKRGRIARITDENIENEDDIFNFGNFAKKTKSFKTSPNTELNIATIYCLKEQDFRKHANICTEMRIHPTKYSPQIKVSPIKITSHGWLSKFNVLKIKKEHEAVATNCNERVENNSIDYSKSFTVRLQKLIFPFKEGSHCCLQNSSNSKLYRSKSNFKTFIKRQNYKPQTVKIRMVPAF